MLYSTLHSAVSQKANEQDTYSLWWSLDEHLDPGLRQKPTALAYSKELLLSGLAPQTQETERCL